MNFWRQYFVQINASPSASLTQPTSVLVTMERICFRMILVGVLLIFRMKLTTTPKNSIVSFFQQTMVLVVVAFLQMTFQYLWIYVWVPSVNLDLGGLYDIYSDVHYLLWVAKSLLQRRLLSNETQPHWRASFLRLFKAAMLLFNVFFDCFTRYSHWQVNKEKIEWSLLNVGNIWCYRLNFVWTKMVEEDNIFNQTYIRTERFALQLI